MKKINYTSVGNSNDIVDVVLKGEDRYDVYFDFAPCPVTMNGHYLKSVMKDLGLNDLPV